MTSSNFGSAHSASEIIDIGVPVRVVVYNGGVVHDGEGVGDGGRGQDAGRGRCGHGRQGRVVRASSGRRVVAIGDRGGVGESGESAGVGGDDLVRY